MTVFIGGKMLNSKRRFIIAPVVVIIGIALAVYFVWKNASNKRNANEISGSGTIEVTEVDVSAKIVGKIEEIKADEGDRVTKDQLLVVLSHDELNAQLKQSEANLMAVRDQLSQVQAQFRNVKENYNRAQELFKNGSFSQQQFDAAETQYRVVSAQLSGSKQLINQAQAQIDLIKTQIDNAYLKSPISGVVLQKNVEAGEMISPGTAILTIGDLSRPWIKIYISTLQTGKIKLNDKADIRVDALPDKTYTGRITNISSEAEFTPKNIQTKDERTRLVYAVKISLENMNEELKPGMTADAMVNIKDSKASTVHGPQSTVKTGEASTVDSPRSTVKKGETSMVNGPQSMVNKGETSMVNGKQ